MLQHTDDKCTKCTWWHAPSLLVVGESTLELLQELLSEVTAWGILGYWVKTAWPAVALTTAAALGEVCDTCAAASDAAVDAAAQHC